MIEGRISFLAGTGKYQIAGSTYTISKSKMILRRLGGGDEAYCTYVEEADNDANKNSALI
jgi:hypothetical protein